MEATLESTGKQQGKTRKSATVEAVLCVPEDQKRFLPKPMCAPGVLPPGAPIPRAAEVIYLAPGSPWAVSMIIHSWLAPKQLRVEVWLEYLSASTAGVNTTVH